MRDRVIYDLCGGSGSWSAPYAEAGYMVRVVTLPADDVRTWKRTDEAVHGILAAPPCTEFAVSGARWWAEKPPELLADALAVLHACRRIIDEARPVWWALENPPGRCLRKILGAPLLSFQPCDYGDPYTKRTLVWGRFKPPAKSKRVEPTQGSKMHLLPPSKDRAALRSVTPAGFARAFFEVNR